MSNILKRFLGLKIRRRRRWRAGSGLYVVLNRAAGRFQIDDIGMGGLSFHYIDTGMRAADGWYDLKIFSEHRPEEVVLEGRTVAESDTGELIFQNKKIKRRSIRFERVNRQQREKLRTLLSRCAKK